MSKTTKKSPAKKVVAAKSATKVTTKASPKPAAKTSRDVTVNKNVLMFLVLTLVAAAIMLVIQAQNTNVTNEQDAAQQALENETMVKQEASDAAHNQTEGHNADGTHTDGSAHP